MRINAINSQFNTSKNFNRFGQPMKQQPASAVNPMSVLNQKHEMKKQLMGSNSSNNMPVNSVLDSSKSYLDSLREARNKTKNVNLEKKKLRYSYKAISSKIISCKKSYNAKEVVSQAKREVSRLKKLRSKGEYDSEELEAAIAHAQAMERVAKKKAKHLEEEEMAKAAGGICQGELEDREDIDEISDDELSVEEMEELSAEEMEEMSEEELAELSQEEIDIEEIISPEQIDAMMEDMLNEMSEELTSLMEDMGLDELFDGMGMSAERDMDPADLKMMIIKHRNKEMKDMAKADGEYLKAIFDILAKQKAGGGGAPAIKSDAPAMNFSTSGGGMDLAQVANVPVAEVPVASIDISI